MSGTIVVGVDGSPPSLAALRWAAEEARLRDARVVAVRAWAFTPPAPIAEPGLIPLPPVELAATLEGQRVAAEAELPAAIAQEFPDGVPIELDEHVVEGAAGEALVAEAEDADLVVVGSSGHGGLASVLLGSVSRHVVSHASCPVVVLKE